MRLLYDLSVLRHPHAGTARYATELLAAMRRQAGRDEIVTGRAWRRATRGGPLRKAWNLGSDLAWLTGGAAVTTARSRADAWFSPANVLPFGLSRPLIVTIHDSNVARTGEYDTNYATYARFMFRSAGHRAAAVLTVSADGQRQLAEDLDIPMERIAVAYPGIDHCLRATAGPRVAGMPSSYALFVGQTEPHKNVERLVAAWERGVPEDLHLVIAGPVGRSESRIAAAIAASPARARIHRTGRVSESALARLYADATCFLFPSLAEGFGLPPLEAMARGIPTAVSDIAVLNEVTAAGAIRFDPLDPDAIADAARRLVEDSSLRHHLMEAGPRIAGQYRWERTADVAWRVIRTAAGG